MSKKRKLSQDESNVQQLMNAAVKYGVELISQNHKVFQGAEKFLMKIVPKKD